MDVQTIIKELKDLYPNADCTLNWSNPLELLVATILSAQCTDKRVNIVTKDLFIKYKSAGDFVSISIEELENDIRSCGTFRMKAVSIQESCRIIINKFNGEVPKTMEDMVKLKGVGRKTAAVVLSTAFGIMEGIAIDTHNIRLLRRLGLTDEEDQKKIEQDMMRKTPKKDWAKLSHLLIAHGRSICSAQSPACNKCIFVDRCPSFSVRERKE
ncbi:MAG: endonuclease III [Candidatus Peribacteraceae bacterium]|nr:endonuclease III [Candidatus Peribacteraceae bacterium]